MLLYKLTDRYGKTQGDTQWGPEVTHEARGGAEQDLSSDGWIHAYESPLLALLLNPIHAGFDSPRLWKAEGEVEKRDGALKVGCRKLTTTTEIPLAVVTVTQRVRFAILCAKQVYDDKMWKMWADKWLRGEDRSPEVAEVARAEAWAATSAAEWAAVAAAEWVTESGAAEWAATSAAAAAAEWATESGAEWAAEAARSAARVSPPLDLHLIAEQAIREEV